jgi:hypothetical protein
MISLFVIECRKCESPEHEAGDGIGDPDAAKVDAVDVRERARVHLRAGISVSKPGRGVFKLSSELPLKLRTTRCSASVIAPFSTLSRSPS